MARVAHEELFGMKPVLSSVSALFLAFYPLASLAATPVNIAAIRSAPDEIRLSWSSPDPVDVFLADQPAAKISEARLISRADADGHETVAVDRGKRVYFLLRDAHGGKTVEIAERLVPLEQGSNFRDIGGYAVAGGKHVRWGMIYRSGATPLLSDADLAAVRALGLKAMVDLRSDEERVLAPTRIDGVPYSAVGYSMSAITANLGGSGGANAVYRNFPKLLAPQMRLLFGMLARGDAPIKYNCSAGQDRTGFATAMILSILGVSRDVILQDYHLSTQYRRPDFEMPRIDTVAQAHNPTAMLFAKYQQDPRASAPQPLYDGQGRSLLLSAFDEIDAKWGSVEKYLENEAGITPVEIAAIRAHYLQ